MEEWRKVKLGELSSKNSGAIAIGPFGSRMKADCYVSFGVPVIRGTNISDGRKWKGDWVYVSEQVADSMPNCNVRSGDLVFPHRGSIGEVAIIPDDSLRYMISTSLMKFTSDPEKANPLYLFYYFRSPSGRSEIMKYSSQVGTPGIGQPLASMKQFEVCLPPLAEQNNIAFLLAVIDNKIELNRQMNQTLEGIAQALFKSWFVDFDPVKAKAEGRKLEGLSDDLAALFHGSFTDSQLGSIPVSWEVKDLGSLSSVAIGRTPPRKEHHWFSENPSHNKWISIRDLGTSGIFITQVSEYLTDEAINKFRVPIIKAGTVILSFKLTMGRVAITAEDMYSNEAIAQFNLDESPLNPSYLYFHLKNYDYSILGSTSSIATAVNSQSLKTIKVIVPKPDILEAFERQVMPIMKKIKNNIFCVEILGSVEEFISAIGVLLQSVGKQRIWQRFYQIGKISCGNA